MRLQLGLVLAALMLTLWGSTTSAQVTETASTFEKDRQAILAMAESTMDAMAQAGVGVDDIALCVPHQANLRIMLALADRLGLPRDRVFSNVDRYGNTSSATIPIALAEAQAVGRLQPGVRVLFTAFGGGLSWGSAVVEWAGIPARGAAVPAGAGSIEHGRAS